MTLHTRPRPLRRPLRVVVAAAVGVAGGLLLASPAPAAQPSYVRLAHFSPDTPNVDVYLTSVSRPDWKLVLKGVGYGALSPYQRLQPAIYTVSMRAAGADPASPAVISTTVRATEGNAFTVAGVGPYAGLGLAVLHDDLALPPKDKVRVRVMQASAKAKNVAVQAQNGPTIASSVDYAKTTPYATVQSGTWTLKVGSTTEPSLSVTSPVRLSPGDVYSVLVLDNGSGGLKVETRTDAVAAASGSGTTPTGGVETGAGGTAGLPDSAWVAVALGAAGLALLTAAGTRNRRHRRPPVGAGR